MKNYKNHILTGDAITIVFEDGIAQVTKKNPCYDAVRSCLKNHNYNELGDLVDKPGLLKKKSYGEFEMKAGVVHYKEAPLPQVLGERIWEFLENQYPIDSLRKFCEHLRRNPSTVAREQLYAFLESNKVSIDSDGCFICYKRVREDLKDWYSGTFDNTPGKTVKMDRQAVDPDSHVTCSYGLHVASHNYACNVYQSGRGLLLEVKVNPRHVVSVPTEAGAAKMRVCEYESLHVVGREDIPATEGAYKYRTYYYKGRKGRTFSERLVTSHKPSRFALTCRAQTTDEAVSRFAKMV